MDNNERYAVGDIVEFVPPAQLKSAFGNTIITARIVKVYAAPYYYVKLRWLLGGVYFTAKTFAPDAWLRGLEDEQALEKGV
jgi:hypothetical protein